MHDPIADYLTCIRNAGSAGHATVSMPSSKIKAEISRVLKEEGYISDFEVVDLDNNKKNITVTLKYYQDEAVIEGLKRVSKTSCRIYVAAGEIPAVRGGLGVSILSTPKGVMTGRKARKENVGGELICQVW